MMNRLSRLAVLGLICLPSGALGQEPEIVDPKPQSFIDALFGGRAWIDFNYRLEAVDQESFAKDAVASTLRTALGYETNPWHGLTGLLEFENVSILGDDDSFNSTDNGVIDRPVIADPKTTEINQVYLQQIMWSDLRGRLGRQEVNLDNERFVGAVEWRQNHQSLDAVTFNKSFDNGSRVYYGYVANQNRIFGDDSPIGDAPMNSHLVNAAYNFGEIADLTGYWYLLDYERATDDAISSSTLGLRLTGSHSFSDETKLTYTLEGAQQSDAGNNPNSYDAPYWSAILRGDAYGWSVEGGFEVLGSDSGVPVQTPMATLHKFNGWADKFLATPPDGLEDLWFLLGTKIDKLSLAFIYHDFNAESTSADYGRESNLSAVYPLGTHWVFGTKFADYRADTFSDDTQKIWFWITLKP